ncbi:cation-translocating P-type ATPase [Pigmentiphaga aceris]|uniref:Cation-translocating P-type ATPase n=1 Tax=Pigmentiphaga aceris TaxID=1940612 RepID=A0A5C0ASU7_9BURK|nr:cation-translocating P-type ATPase [Pigmentiphaga aceris]QEI05362.1 cation-translocating P-type ATPase [Pigmentiphaga aceris]
MDITLPATAAASFSAFDDTAAAREFSRPLADGRWESWIAVEGMDCAACGQTIEQSLTQLPGVDLAEVSLLTTRARVIWQAGQVAPSSLFQTIARLGYQPFPAGSAEQEHAIRRHGRMLLWRLMVAAFCMMQVMMYSTVEYVATPGEIPPDQLVLLRWGQWMLCIPVMLFAAWPILHGAWRSLRSRRLGMDVPAALGLVLAFAASSSATFDGGGEVWFDSVSMFVFFLLLSRWVEAWARRRATGQLEALDRRLPAVVMRAEGASFVQVPATQLRQGDRIRVAPGETFPADGTLLEGQTTVDEAILTGESLPAAKGVGASVVAGSQNVSETVDVLVTRPPADSTVARIRQLISAAAQTRPDWVRLADKWAAAFLACVLVLSVAAWIGWQFIDPTRAMGVAIAILIVTCPCALSLAAPAAMLSATAGLARHGIWLREPAALERLLGVRHVAFDKTGTLTEATLALTRIEVLRPGFNEATALAYASALAGSSRHPLSRALAATATATLAPTQWREWAGEGIQASLAGVAHHLGSLPFAMARINSTDASTDDMSGAGSAKSADAASPRHNETDTSPVVWLSDPAGLIACFHFADTPRKDAAKTVAGLHAAGLNTALLSGDRPAAVEELAATVGIRNPLASMSPEEKLQAILHWQANDQPVLMVGDGINDGPALARADVSATLGGAAALAQGQADIVLASGRLSDLLQVRRTALAARRITRQNLVWAASWNAASVPLALVGWMPPWVAGIGMAASSLLVIGNGLRLLRIKG